MRTRADRLATGLGIAYVVDTGEWAIDVWITRRACARIDGAGPAVPP